MSSSLLPSPSIHFAVSVQKRAPMFAIVFVIMFVIMFVTMFVIMFVTMFVIMFVTIFVTMFVTIFVTMFVTIFVIMLVTMFVIMIRRSELSSLPTPSPFPPSSSSPVLSFRRSCLMSKISIYQGFIRIIMMIHNVIIDNEVIAICKLVLSKLYTALFKPEKNTTKEVRDQSNTDAVLTPAIQH